MATYSQYPRYSEQAQHLPTSEMFPYSQYDYQPPKKPTSMINHSGFSPRPISTPPMSRNTSQQPEQLPEQPPDQMAWDDVAGSISNSPTSVRTPDNDAFDTDMLDASEEMRNFYEAPNVDMMTTHVSHQTLPAFDQTMLFSDQGLLSFQTSLQYINIYQFSKKFCSPPNSSRIMKRSQYEASRCNTWSHLNHMIKPTARLILANNLVMTHGPAKDHYETLPYPSLAWLSSILYLTLCSIMVLVMSMTGG